MLIHQLWGFIPAILEFGGWKQKDQEFMVIFNYIDTSLGYLRACLKSQKAKFKNNYKGIVNMRAMSEILHGYYSTECSEGLHGGATVSPILDK